MNSKLPTLLFLFIKQQPLVIKVNEFIKKMKILSVVFMLLQFHLLTAQINDSQFAQLNDTIIAPYNRTDYNSIYTLGNDNFRMAQGQEDFKNQLTSLYNQTGKIKETVSIHEYENGRSFKWIGEKRNLRFDFFSKTGSDINEFNISDFIEQSYLPAKKVLSDNKLQTRIDSIVNSNALIYMLDPKSVGLSIGIFKDGKTYHL